jgi:serine protease
MKSRAGLFIGGASVALALTVVAPSPAGADTAVPAHHPIYMPNLQNTNNPALQPPPVCCLPVPEAPAGQPAPVNMAYFGGHVEVSPRVYLVLWGWGEPGAFNHTTPGMPADDPDGAGARMIAFLRAAGGTPWAGVATQYYELQGGKQVFIRNPKAMLAGVWWDNSNPIHNNVTGLGLAQEAQRAVAHFGVTDLKDAQFVIAQPQEYNEQGFNSGAGYCAWHDYTNPSTYPGVTPGISFTNMPYVLNAGASCGEHAVNSGYYAGRLDGFTIVVGHEVEETVTDPGAEVGQATVGTSSAGGWYDYAGYEIGDKCAWVGDTGLTAPSTVPGGLNDIRGNDGRLYAVQSMWSNTAANGAGYCAGAGDDLPGG